MARKITVTDEEVAAFNEKYLVWNVSYERHIQGTRGMPPCIIKIENKTAFGFTQLEAEESFERAFKGSSKRKIHNVKATYRCTMAKFNQIVFGNG